MERTDENLGKGRVDGNGASRAMAYEEEILAANLLAVPDCRLSLQSLQELVRRCLGRHNVDAADGRNGVGRERRRGFGGVGHAFGALDSLLVYLFGGLSERVDVESSLVASGMIGGQARAQVEVHVPGRTALRRTEPTPLRQNSPKRPLLQGRHSCALPFASCALPT